MRNEAEVSYNAEIGSQNRLKADSAAASRGQSNEKNELWMICHPGRALPRQVEVNDWVKGPPKCPRGIQGARNEARRVQAAEARLAVAAEAGTPT